MNPDLTHILQGVIFYLGSSCFLACVAFILINLMRYGHWKDDDARRQKHAYLLAVGFLLITAASLFSGFRPW